MTSSGLTLDNFDRSVRPQDDLFGFVNGSWRQQTDIPSDRARYGSFDRLREASEAAMRELIQEAAASDAEAGTPRRKVGDLYTSFMDEARAEQLGTDPLADDLSRIEAVGTPADVLRVVGELQRTGVSGFVGFYSIADAKDPQRNVLYVLQDGIGLPDESYYREDQHAEVREQYVAHMGRLLGLAGLDAGLAQTVMALETRLAKSHWDRVKSRDAVKTYNKMSRAELEELTPGVEWDAWLEGVGADAKVLDPANVEQPSYLTGFAEALRDEPIEAWRAWLTWRLVSDRASYLTGAMVEEDFDFNGRTLSGIPQLKERWKRGVDLVESLIGEAAGQLYVEKHFPPHAKERMVELVANLLEAFRRDFEGDLPWMGSETRGRALDKLSKFTPKIGYPEEWKDYSAIEIRADDLVGNVSRASAWEVDRMLRRVGEPVDEKEWFMTPQTVNAYYMPVMNEIVFPAAILQPPFFDVDADDAVNYGGIGAVIGHEVGHGFDDQGSRYDGDGSLTDWWTEDDRTAFDALAKKLIDQFDQLEPLDAPGNKVNGSLTVGENIGDLGGLTIGYKAYRIAQETTPAPELDGFTGDQRFFLGWAQVWCGKAREAEAKRLLTVDPHSPTDVRANVARNLPEFHEAFGVTEGDGMHLPEAEQVRIF
ncbi:M13 family metallopeptidase [Luteipulveratus flavus]|uniref:M13-type metalloendopeptidase n=1 Tax=Luteipulveratus flavus TaxID=3031728 RepID=A0ABT6C6Q4_9MICO|nr:M13-type metalloendopeptidase [Luteipulveratus sp. YIM 133296]MDF8264599.1 M13-type metalloendopeptidase [Luteipulveratus sp. YIM 133296]